MFLVLLLWVQYATAYAFSLYLWTLLVARYQLLERPVTETGEAKTTAEL